MKPKTSYDQENDILYVRFNDKDYHHSIEIPNFGSIIVDYDTNGNMCGVEYMDYKQKLKLIKKQRRK